MLDGFLEGHGKGLRPVPVDPVHLIRPGHSVLLDHPFPATEAGDLLGLGQLALSLAQLPGSLPDPLFQLVRRAQQRLAGSRALGDEGGEHERREGDVESRQGEPDAFVAPLQPS